MADDHVLSMSLDEIIKLNKRSGGSDTRQRTNTGARGNGARGATYQVKTGKPRITGARAQIRRRGGRTQVGNTPTRGRIWNQGSNVVRGHFARYRNVNKNHQRQYQIALGRSKLQMAKRFLRMRQRGRTTGIVTARNTGLMPRVSVRGIRGQRFRRGRIGVQSPRLVPNSFRSDQLLRLSRLNTYRNKVNRKLSSTRLNQEAAGPSLIVSIANERAGMSTTTSIRRTGRRRGGLTGTMRQAYGRAPTMSYQQRNTLPYHTGALNPEIQMVIAGIQGKSNPNTYGVSTAGLRRGQAGGRGLGQASGRGLGQAGGRGLGQVGGRGMGQTSGRGLGQGGRGFGGFSRRGRTQLPMGFVDNSRRLGLPLGITGNTLNERFSSLR